MPEDDDRLPKYFQKVSDEAGEIFESKLEDYGAAFLVLRTESLVDKIWIKLRRIRKLEEADEQRISEGRRQECLAVINYSAIGLIKTNSQEMPQRPEKVSDVNAEDVLPVYEETMQEAEKVIKDKTHDYGKSWKIMHQHSMIDFSLEKTIRMKEMTSSSQNHGKEAISDELLDVLNYTVMYLFKLENGI